MPAIPLAINAYRRSSAFQPEVRCRNVYIEEDKSGASPDGIMRIGRPGLTIWNTLPANVRGIYSQSGLFGGGTYGVAGSRLYSMSFGSETDIGGVGNGDRVRWAANYEKLFVLSTFVAFQYDGLAVDGIEMPDLRDVQDMDVLNNFLILLCPDGRFYWLEPGQDEIDPLNFATAESSPDGAVAVCRLGDEIVIFGVDGGEVWQTTGAEDAPFLRAGGRNFDRGCLSRDAVLKFDNSILWVGDDCIVYRFGNVPQRISDHGIEQRLRDRSGVPSACIVEADGHKHYVLKIPGQGSFAFDAASGEWSDFGTGEDDAWRPHCSTGLEDGWLVGDEGSGRIWLYDPDAATDDGEIIQRVVSGTIAIQGLGSRNDSLSIGAGGSADYNLKVRWRDGRDEFPSFYEELEVRAPADIVSLYRLGVPDQPYRTFELLIDEPVRPRISGAMVNEAWQ